MSHYESSEEENESEEQHHSKEYYGEIRGEYEDDGYEHDGEEYWYVQSPEHKTRTSGSSLRSSSRGSKGSDYRHHLRKSFKKSIVGGLGYTISEEETQHQDNQDLIDSLPDDISMCLQEYWQKMEDFYYPVHENCFEWIDKIHKKLLGYPSYFQQEFVKQIEAPDDRANVAELFKSDFNRLPLVTRINDQIKPVLFKRISELLVKLEGITEEKYATGKHIAYKILTKGFFTAESEKLARLFGVLLQAETDRFADTIKFINEHYYTIISIELGMPNKVRWKEIMDIGLIKKKFICEHFIEQCLLREELQGGESWKETDNGSSSDSDLCGGGTRGQDFSMICEDDEESTPTEEDLSRDSFFNKYGDEDEEMYFGDTDVKMNGEMKLSLEFDNEEFLGEGGWEGFSSHRNSAQSAGTVEKLEGDGDGGSSDQAKGPDKDASTTLKPDASGTSFAQKRVSGDGVSKSAKTVAPTESKTKGEQPNSNDNKRQSEASKSSMRKQESGKKGIQQEKDGDEEEEAVGQSPGYPEEYDEELEMEPDEVQQNPDYFEDEYPGEFWEGEGYGIDSYRNSKLTGKGRQSSVKFDEKQTYIRDFFWDSDPSKQDATDVSKAEKEKAECKTASYFDLEELFDDEDVFYDRDEFFEKEVENPRKNAKENTNTSEPQELHFAIFGRERDDNLNNMSLLNTLLMRWTSKQGVEPKKTLEQMEDLGFVDGEEDGEEHDGEQDDEDVYGRHPGKSISSSTKGYFSPSTPTSATKHNDAKQNLVDANFMTVVGSTDVPFRTSFLDNEKGDGVFLLKLHPSSNAPDSNSILSTAHMMQQKRPLLECFVNLQDEIWNGFEIAFRGARMNITKVIASLKDVVSRGYPIEKPKDPCEEETDVDELIAKGEAIKAKYRVSFKQPDRASKSHKHVQLRGSFDGEEEVVEIEVEGDDMSPEQDEENEEEENNLDTPKSSFVELVPLQPRKMSTELESLEHESNEKRSSVADSAGLRSKKEKRVSIEESGSLKKTSVLAQDSGSASNNDKTQSMEDSPTAEEEKENVRKSSVAESANDAETEEVPMLENVNSPQSDARTASTDRKSTNLERTPADTDIRFQDSPQQGPSPEEKKILKRAKHALLKSKLQNWESALEMEAERLARQLTLIEAHAQHEFRILKGLPSYVWENSKSQAANVYIDDLKRDSEIGEVFKTAIQDGSPLYGKFYIDRHDLMLLLKGNESAIPLKYTDEFLELSNSLKGRRRSKKSEFIHLEE